MSEFEKNKVNKNYTYEIIFFDNDNKFSLCNIEYNSKNKVQNSQVVLSKNDMPDIFVSHASAIVALSEMLKGSKFDELVKTRKK